MNLRESIQAIEVALQRGDKSNAVELLSELVKAHEGKGKKFSVETWRYLAPIIAQINLALLLNCAKSAFEQHSTEVGMMLMEHYLFHNKTMSAEEQEKLSANIEALKMINWKMRVK